MWTTGWRRLRAHSDGEFRDAVTEAAALHSRDDLFSKHIEPEPAHDDPVEGPWQRPQTTRTLLSHVSVVPCVLPWHPDSNKLFSL